MTTTTTTPQTAGSSTAATAAAGSGTAAASSSSSCISMTTTARPPFPEPGSLLGTEGRYFTLTRLGRGTFCSIHKCVDLAYHHDEAAKNHVARRQNRGRRHRLVAAKVELSTFCGSGVLDGEATILRHLSESCLESQVPQFLHYVREIPGGTAQDAGTVIDDQTGKPFVAAGGGGAGGTPTSMTAIVMEYLSGEDMHQLRDRHCQAIMAGHSSAAASRRIAIADAVYLVADVMLPLLESMHQVGVIHRDVKPSNCVRVATSSDNRHFKMVDFGLSKSFVVPTESPQANRDCPWVDPLTTRNRPWYAPPPVMAALNAPPPPTEEDNSQQPQQESPKQPQQQQQQQQQLQYPKGSLRQERKDAEFRGTSMYASLRVHQGRDYCRRDDLWGLLYVFCDLVSGGLPWMAYAASKDRNMCRLIKEVVHGERTPESITLDAQGRGCVVKEEEEGETKDPSCDESNNKKKDNVEWLLMGADYHLSKHKRDVQSRSNEKNKSSSSSSSSSLPPLAEPLSMSRDETKVHLLRTAFDHVSSLTFTDEPNYGLLRKCLRQFLASGSGSEDDVALMDWTQTPPPATKKRRRGPRRKRRETPLFELLHHAPHDLDPLTARHWDDMEEERYVAAATEAAHYGLPTPPHPGGILLSPATLKAAALQPDIANLARLPLELQLRLAQVEYHAAHCHTVPPHIALRDWMALAQLLLYDKWNTRHWERWGASTTTSATNSNKSSSKRRRSSANDKEGGDDKDKKKKNDTDSDDSDDDEDDDDGHRREVYMKMVSKCLEAAKPFGYFCQPSCLFWTTTTTNMSEWKRRDIQLGYKGSALLEVSKAIVGLQVALEEERVKKYKPLPTISFSSIQDEHDDDDDENAAYHAGASATTTTNVSTKVA